MGPVVPTIDLVLHKKDVVWRIFGSNSMVRIVKKRGVDVLRLPFVDDGLSPTTPDSTWIGGPSIVIGGHQLEDNMLQFDLEYKKLGFSSSILSKGTNCSNFKFSTKKNGKKLRNARTEPVTWLEEIWVRIADDLRPKLVPELGAWTAQQLLKYMCACEKNPDIIIYSTLVHGFCIPGNLDEALVLFPAMQRGGSKPHLLICNILIDGMCKFRKIQDAKGLFSRLPDQGFQLEVYTYNPLIGRMAAHPQRMHL
ncbi:unnamed protein product [Dovyalis caffra]|uniref:Xylanase inhibitor C-terminal domain-containing protein n=1 Tax=Dovyalis caffra TaxID=77055 RepID=A0AAV1SRI6_9ROSI|nr:unnamed protein product [Dovyalis caffra]